MEDNNQNTNNVPSQGKSGGPLASFDPNVSAALSYLLPPITGIVFFLLEKDNKFVRFHAMQSILFGVASIVASLIAGALTSVLIGFILGPIVSIASFVLWLFLMWKAYNKEEYMLPYLGKIAKDQIEK